MDIGAAVIQASIRTAIDFIKGNLPKLFQKDGYDESTIERSINDHMTEVVAWSGRMQSFGMSRGEETDTRTIPLQLREPRQFRSVRSDLQKNENDLIADPDHYLLLGNPGAGKTTTLKRIVRQMLLSEGEYENDTFQCPIVLRLREMSESSIYIAIANIFGLPYEIRTIHDHSVRARSGHEVVIAGRKIENVIPEILNAMQVVVLVDGLDEIGADHKADTWRVLSKLTLRSVSYKVIVSCRTGDYLQNLEGFSVVELCPLTAAQIQTIAEQWVPESQSFIAALERVPYKDLADRPLLLNQLLLFPSAPPQDFRSRRCSRRPSGGRSEVCR